MNIYLNRIAYLCFIVAFTQYSSATSSSSSSASSSEEPSESVAESMVTLPQESEAIDIFSRQPNFMNPVYPIKSNVDQIYIPNASVANFSSDGIVGMTIRYAQSKNDIPNPNGYTHSAFLFHANPLVLTQRISDMIHTEGTELFKYPQYGAEMIYDIRDHYPEAAGIDTSLLVDRVFCAESDGSAGEVLKGIYPHVHIHPFEQSVATYGGEVSFRPCAVEVDPKDSLDVVLRYVGTSYESPFTLGGMLKAINDKNKVAKSDRLFCSEFVALAYRELGLLPSDLIPDNVIPEELSAGAGEYDLLRGFCGQDIKLKLRHRRLFCGCCC